MELVNQLKRFIEERYSVRNYPTLFEQSKQWSVSRPLNGLRVLDCTPVFANTVAKYIPLLEAGALLSVGVSQVMPCDRDVLTFLKGCGIDICEPNCDVEFDVILDCAGAFSKVKANIGYVELTRSGVDVYSNCEKPVFVADSSRIKRIETSLGTGEGYFRAMTQLGFCDWKGRMLVIFGAGKVGKGLKMYGEKVGAKVVVFDENSDENVVRATVADAYAIVSATGVKGALDKYFHDLQKSNALIANMGVEDEFGENLSSDRVLEHKRPLNFILKEPTHMRYIETTMALHNRGALEILKSSKHRGLIEPSMQLETEFLEIVARDGNIGNELILL